LKQFSNLETCKIFEEFLTKEFSIENLLCFKAIRNLDNDIVNRVISEQAALSNCRKVSRAFCGPDCRLPVNVPSKTAVKVSDICSTENIGLEQAMTALKEMQQDVLNLMKNDSFIRFKNEKEFETVRKILHGNDGGQTTSLI
jgi:hypothetical protein